MAEEQKPVEEQIKEEIKKLPKQAKARAVALNNILNEKRTLDEELEKEIKAIELKYEQLSLPIYQKSAQLIQGQRLPTDQELGNLEEYLNEQEKAQDKNSLIDIPENHQPIEGYWLQVLKNCDQVANDIHPNDEEPLKALVNVEFQKVGGESQDFSLTFTFKQNEHFTNDKLVKKFFFKEGEEEHYKTEGTEINWKEGKNITKKIVKKKQKNKKSGQQRTVTKEVDDESFFNFFKSTELKEEQENDEEEQLLLEKMNVEADIAQTIIEEVIPYSLEYYFGIKNYEEDDQDYGEEEDFEDDEDVPEGSEDEDDSPKAPKTKKKAVKPQHKSSNDKEPKEGQQQAECKQQ